MFINMQTKHHYRKRNYGIFKLLFWLVFLAALFFVGYQVYRIFFLSQKIPTQDGYYNSSNHQSIVNQNGNSATDSGSVISTTNQEILDKVNIDVPFTVQAPTANWDATHEEACEEASLIMVQHYIKGTKFDSTDSADQEILALIGWETQNGYALDVTTSQLSQIASSYYGIKSGRVKTGATIDDIKRELSAGRPVVVGAAGKVLPQPNFRDGGPNYHMLVITGYNKNGFITNDPGTRKGQGFRYTFDGLFNAVHDWNPNNILDGGKDYLVFD
jgi:uncharacterized protein YvpB